MDVISLLNNKNINIMQAWDMKAAWQRAKPENDANQIAVHSIGQMRQIWPDIAKRVNAKAKTPTKVTIKKSNGTPKTKAKGTPKAKAKSAAKGISMKKMNQTPKASRTPRTPTTTKNPRSTQSRKKKNNQNHEGMEEVDTQEVTRVLINPDFMPPTPTNKQGTTAIVMTTPELMRIIDNVELAD